MKTAMIARRNFLRTSAFASGAGLFPASMRAQTAAAAGRQTGGPAQLHDQRGKGLRDRLRTPGVDHDGERRRRHLHASDQRLPRQLGQLRVAGLRQTRAGRQERPGSSPVHLPVCSGPPPLRPAAAIRGHRHLPVGSSGQGDGAAGLPDSGSLQGPRPGVRQFPAPSDQDAGPLRGSGAEGQSGGIPGVQDQPAAGRSRRRQPLPAGYGDLQGSAKSRGRRLHADAPRGGQLHAAAKPWRRDGCSTSSISGDTRTRCPPPTWKVWRNCARSCACR